MNLFKSLLESVVVILSQFKKPLSRTENAAYTEWQCDFMRTFAVVISEPISKEYRIRIRHNLASGEH